MRQHRPAAVLLLALGALLMTSCSSERDVPAAGSTVPTAPARSAAPSLPPASTPASTPSPTDVGASMTITGFEYVLPASVPSGAQVTVVNQDREAHTVTVDRGATRLTVLPGATAVFTAPSEPGAHPVTCDLHGGMDAVLVVA